MAGIYTRRFVAKTVPVGASFQTVWTVPADGIYILRSVVLSNFQSTAGVSMVDFLTLAPVSQIGLIGGSIPATSVISAELRQELKAGETVRVYTPTTGCGVALTGYFFPN